jgi:hypothetical protein
MSTRLVSTAALAIACLTALLVAASGAAAATYPVSGEQTVVSEHNGTYRMKGGLIGSWKTTSFKEIAKSPIYRAKGTEHFQGCLDSDRNGSCAGDPSGTLDFRFLYWGKFGPGDSLVWGSCWHPVTGGTGDFAGAEGVLTMVDTPTASGVSTSYTGNITIGGTKRARSASLPHAHCG